MILQDKTTIIRQARLFALRLPKGSRGADAENRCGFSR